MWKEFKEFAFKGNVLDMAVGVIIGGAFSKIVSSLVNDVIMPLFGALTGGMSFTDWKLVIKPAVVDAAGKVIEAENAITYGAFIQNVIDFLLIAASIFMFIKIINSVKDKCVPKAEEVPQEETPALPTETELLAEIRDLLKDKQ